MKDLTSIKQGRATTIQNKDGKCLTEEQDIPKRWSEYCSELYSYRPTGDPEVLNVLPATSKQRPATSDQRPATSDQRPATSNQQPATSNQQPATSNQQPATSNQQPATSNQQRQLPHPSRRSGSSGEIAQEGEVSRSGNVLTELVQTGGEAMISALLTICNKIWQTDCINRFKYLGAIIADEGSKPEILARIAQTTAALAKLKTIWNDNTKGVEEEEEERCGRSKAVQGSQP